ncbi:carboxypeptidase-like regulatory domain-containing protein [Hymenobacter properus]|uniref:Carboxypeptidase-like regulatory domain-containing protein n=1 Tax=Hymenobacter properus TaxID=2791026 RepID=A0A931BDC0_9BACT|nr:carboxypeptidase-like regulatory domain-containing protein [Hymenobacter properus]MBF9140496.1 carboxypeptidase-like regulatory domain-containing protein [Hymenobacter properus]MBR7719303.1 carboxypeptidase-like regulatory domain-containing protein [Microvirga sp. SRT04]
MLPRLFLLLLLALTSLLPSRATAQAPPLAGRVQAASGQPVAFATVGVKGKAIGTTADATGRFAFAPPPTLTAADSVIISCVGFRSLRLTVAQLQRPGAVWTLQPMSQELQEVHVRHAQLKPGFIGCRSTFSPLQWTTDSAADVRDVRGWELATMVPVRKNSFVDSFRVYFAHNEFRSLRLRFLLYDVQHGKPDRLLVNDDIQFLVPNQRTGWVGLDLRRYNLYLTKGQTVAAGIQWLQGEKATPKSQRLSGPVLLPTLINRTLIRQKSQAAWEKYAGNVSMYLAVQQYE